MQTGVKTAEKSKAVIITEVRRVDIPRVKEGGRPGSGKLRGFWDAVCVPLYDYMVSTKICVSWGRDKLGIGD